jgi:PhnB protein
MSTLVPHLVCPTATAAIAFYKKVFHAEEVRLSLMPDGRVMHCELKIGGDSIMVCDDFPEWCGGKSRTPAAYGGSPVTINVTTKDCDAMVNGAAAAGAKVTMPPADMFWGDRYAQFTDPYGHQWAIVQHIKQMTQAEIDAAAKTMFGGKKG